IPLAIRLACDRLWRSNAQKARSQCGVMSISPDDGALVDGCRNAGLAISAIRSLAYLCETLFMIESDRFRVGFLDFEAHLVGIREAALDFVQKHAADALPLLAGSHVKLRKLHSLP